MSESTIEAKTQRAKLSNLLGVFHCQFKQQPSRYYPHVSPFKKINKSQHSRNKGNICIIVIVKHTSCQTSEQPGTSWLSIYYMFSAPRNNSVLAIHYRNNQEYHCQFAPWKHEQQHLTFISQMVAGKEMNPQSQMHNTVVKS